MGALFDMTETKILALVKEIALDIKDIPDILQTTGVTWEQYDAIKETDYFKRMLEEAISAWNSALNAQERLKLKAATALEDFVPELYGRLHDRAEPLNHKVEGAKLLARIAGVDAPNNGAGVVGERFTVTINMGTATPVQITKDVTPQGNLELGAA
jgi:hypothetical protein